MLLKETIHKTLEKLKFLFFKGYQKLHKTTSLIPFSCTKGNKTDPLYFDIYDEWQSSLHKEPNKQQEDSTNIAKEEQIHPRSSRLQEKKKQGTAPAAAVPAAHLRKGDVKNSSTRSDGLAQKMKELEMLDRGDMEQDLDIEEAIHYYSRLRSPVYLEIVDKFFMDIHSEFSVPLPYAKSMNSSKRRMGSMRL